MEYWDIYDADRCPKNKTAVRGEDLNAGDYHTVVHICIFNSKGKMLIQKRQPFKKGWSGLWDITCGGSVLAGETSQEGAERELREELGIELSLKGKRPHITVNFDTGFDDVYIVHNDIDLDSLKLQYEEVQEAKWATLEEILEMICEGTFIPYFKSFITLMFEARRQSDGCIVK